MGQGAVFTQELARVVAALTDFFTLVGVPGSRFFNQVVGHRQVDDFAFAADALPVHDVELGGLERRGHLVFDDLHLGFAANHLVALFDGAHPADVQTHRRVKLQRVSARGGFGAAEHHTDLHADLVDENDRAVGLFDGGGQFAQRLAHESGLQAGQAVAHFAFQLGLGGERGH